jgi:carboxyl-terminal processing protease
MKRSTFWLSAVVFLAAVFVGGHLALGEITKKPSDTLSKEIGLYTEALNFVRTQHVKPTDPKDLVYASIAGMLGHLDPYSAFLTPEEFNELKIGIEGHFAGVGVEVASRHGFIVVIAPIVGTPAWEAGVLPGDKIVKIDDVFVKDFSLSEVVKRLRGRAGTRVKVAVWRDRDKAMHEFVIKRAEVVIQDVRDQKVIDPGFGYLRIVEFQEKTPQNLDKALEDLKGRGATGLIIDLRDNPGGLLEQAVEATQRFLEPGAPIVTVQGRDPRQKEVFVATYKKADVKTPLVLLINEGSASGSEIMAGALRLQNRAVLVGARTFGKGSVQTIQPLRDGSALKLTTATYVLANGACLEENGIIPDVPVDDAARETKAVPSEKEESSFDEETEEEASFPVPAAKGPDPVLERAVDILEGLKASVKT